VHRLIEKASRAASGLGFCEWRMAPTGWVWNAEFATRADAEDYLVGKLVQQDR
jgi:hypothetical protein